MAIEDAAVLAQCLERMPADPARALRRYQELRVPRTARTQREAVRNGSIYHLGGVGASLRTLMLSVIGGRGLLRRYDWLYGWQPP
jgi:salicylate hydroxylase